MYFPLNDFRQLLMLLCYWPITWRTSPVTPVSIFRTHWVQKEGGFVLFPLVCMSSRMAELFFPLAPCCAASLRVIPLVWLAYIFFFFFAAPFFSALWKAGRHLLPGRLKPLHSHLAVNAPLLTASKLQFNYPPRIYFSFIFLNCCRLWHKSPSDSTCCWSGPECTLAGPGRWHSAGIYCFINSVLCVHADCYECGHSAEGRPECRKVKEAVCFVRAGGGGLAPRASVWCVGPGGGVVGCLCMCWETLTSLVPLMRGLVGAAAQPQELCPFYCTHTFYHLRNYERRWTRFTPTDSFQCN